MQNTTEATIPPIMLYATVFVSGMSTLAIELTASRLLGYVFGTSNIVWANIIGLILLYLTVGYFVGGRLADRSPHPRTMYTIILAAAFLSAIVPLIARPILYFAASAVSGIQAGLAIGSFLAVLVLFALPITLLGMVSPFAIRLATSDVSRVGSVSGRIYAISTLGSLIGTFLPVLFIIPELGTTATFLIFSGCLGIVAIVGLVRYRVRRLTSLIVMMPIIAVAFAVGSQQPVRAAYPGQTLLFEDETAYNYVQVQQDVAGNRYLYLNEGQGIHSQWHPTNVYYGRTWDYFLAAPYFNPGFAPDDMQSMLIIGLAAGTIARQHIAVYGDIPIDGVEIDPEIIDIGTRYFDMNSDVMPSLTTYAEDGRYILNQLAGTYTIIAIDAYRPPYIPWHLTTVEFFEEVQRHLAPDGVVAINVGRTPDDRRLVEALTHTMLQVYPTVHTLDVPASFNTILVATNRPTDDASVSQNLVGLPDDAHPLLRRVLTDAVQAAVATRANDILFTDDRAPVETLVDSLVINFLFSGELELIGSTK